MGSEDAVGADPPPGVGRRCFVTNREGGTEAAHPSGQRIEGRPSLGRGLGCPGCPVLPWGRVPSTALVPGMLHRPDQHVKAPIATQPSDGEAHRAWLLPITASNITQQPLPGAPRSPAETPAPSSAAQISPVLQGGGLRSRHLLAEQCLEGSLYSFFFRYSALHYIL